MPTAPFQSKLNPVAVEIMTAWYQRKKLREIQAALAEMHGIDITLSGLAKYIRRRQFDLPPELIFAGATAKENNPQDKAARIKAMLDEELSKNPDDLIREQALKDLRKK